MSIDTAAPDAEVWDWVRRVQSGDSAAFGLIYDRYQDTVFRYIYLRAGQNRQLTEDLTSDTFLRALRNITTVNWQGRDLGAWLVTIAKHLVFDHFKSGRVRLDLLVGEVNYFDQPDLDLQGSPEVSAINYLTNRELLAAVNRLNPEQREVIVLRFLCGLSVTETAEIMGKLEGAIKALQYRAVRTLRRILPVELVAA